MAADEQHGLTRRDAIRSAAVAAGLVWSAPAVKSVRMLGTAGTPPPSTTSPTTAPPPSVCSSIAVNVPAANGFSTGGHLDAGDVLTVTVGLATGWPAPTSIEMLVVGEERFIQNAPFPNTLSFTIPQTGEYFLQVTVDGGNNAAFTASCTPAPG